MLAKHPDTTFILAHMGWHANDLGRLGKMFDKLRREKNLGEAIKWRDGQFAKYE